MRIHPEWRAVFPRSVWQQGEMYYRNGAVVHLNVHEDEAIALIEGEELFAVVSALFDPESGRVEDFCCSCADGEDGKPCAHLAALFCALEANNREEVLPEMEADLKIDAVVQLLSEDQMRALLLEFAERDAYVEEKLRLTATRRLPESQRVQWEADLTELTRSMQDRHGFVNYEKAWKYCAELGDYLEVRVEDLLSVGLCKDAFVLTCMVFEQGMHQAMDDSDGGLTVLARICTEKWSSILQCAAPVLQREMFCWFTAHYAEDTIGGYFVQEYIFEAPWDRTMALLLLAFMDKEIETLRKQPGKEYRLQDLVIHRLRWMEQIGAAQVEIECFIEEYRYLSAVRALLIDRAIERGDDREALALLQESKMLDQQYPGRLEAYYRQEIEIYARGNRQKELRAALESYVFTFSQHDLSYVDQLKAMSSPEEWTDLRERLLNCPTTSWLGNALLVQEGMIDRLMERVEEGADIYALERYEALLGKRFPERCGQVLIAYLQPAMDRATNLKAYWSVIQVLKKLRKYSEADAKKLAEAWKMQYPRRTAMLDELREAGF